MPLGDIRKRIVIRG